MINSAGRARTTTPSHRRVAHRHPHHDFADPCSSASLRVDFVVHRNGDTGSLRAPISARDSGQISPRSCRSTNFARAARCSFRSAMICNVIS
jgi:hypothetical protein